MTFMYRLFGLIILFSLCLSPNLQAQFGQGGNKAIEKLKNTETLVVLGYDDEYNEAIQEAFNNHWTFTKYRFIPGTHYKRYCKDPQYSFVMIFTIREWQVVNEQYDDIGIVLGGNCNTGPYDMVAYANMDVYSPSYYRLECQRAVQFMQDYLETGEERKMPRDNIDETIEMYNERHAEMADKELVLCEEDIIEKHATIDKVKKYYTHPVRLDAQFQVDRNAWRQTENYLYTVFLYDVNGFTYRCVVEAKGSRMLFMMPTENHEAYLMGPRSFKRMNNLEFGKKVGDFIKGI